MKKFIIILLTCLLSINIFSGCNESTKNNTKKTEKQITIDKPNFKTKTIKTESASYKIPDSFSGEHTMDLDDTMTDNKSKTVSLSIEVETSLPIWASSTIMSNDVRIIEPTTNIYTTNEIS